MVDRPTQGHKYLSRTYVQPQWVLDSANFRVLADAELYAPGKHPPPHLSPFVTYDDEGYVPDYAKAMLKLQVEALTPCMPVSSCVFPPPVMLILWALLLHIRDCRCHAEGPGVTLKDWSRHIFLNHVCKCKPACWSKREFML